VALGGSRGGGGLRPVTLANAAAAAAAAGVGGGGSGGGGGVLKMVGELNKLPWLNIGGEAGVAIVTESMAVAVVNI